MSVHGGSIMAPPMVQESAATTPRDVDAVCEFCGALAFVVGSYYFVVQALVDKWIPPYRTGSAWWVGGCVFNLVPPCRQLYRTWRYSAAIASLSTSDSNTSGCCANHLRKTSVQYALLQVGGMLGYGIGCSLSFFPDCCIPLGPINILFCIGSACLVGDPALQAARTWQTCSRVALAVLVSDFYAGFFFCLASVFGGYASDTGIVAFGESCWGAGSLLGLVKPCTHFRARWLERAADSTSKNELV